MTCTEKSTIPRSDEDNQECPLCMEPFELDDINFFPCTCGYQICRFCWHRIRTNENGLCPACRKLYSEDPANFKPLTNEELHRIKNEKRQKDLQRKQKISENRKHLSNLRVVQKNLVFVIGLPMKLADADELRKSQYFGKFGKIVKIIVNQNTTYAGPQGRSASAFITYQKPEDALNAIQSVNNSKVDGRTLKASLGTTKYCSYFLKKLHCPKQDCMYLHELGYEAASFTKEEMQAGKHQEYERKLYEQIMASNSSQNRKQSSPTNHTEATFPPKENRTSPPKNEAPSQSSIPSTCSSSHPTQSTSNSIAKEKTDLVFHNSSCGSQERYSTNMLPNNAAENHFTSVYSANKTKETPHLLHCNNADKVPSAWQDTSVAVSDHKSSSNFCHQEPVSFQSQSNLSPFERHSLSRKYDISQQSAVNGTLESSQSMDLLNTAVTTLHQEKLVNGFSNFLPTKSFGQNQEEEWLNSHSKNYLIQSGRLGTSTSSFPLNSQPQITPTDSLFAQRNASVSNRFPTCVLQNSVQSNMCNGVNNHIPESMKSLHPTGENLFCNPEDDLGFDPWHESAKGLADLMVEEADNKAQRACDFLPPKCTLSEPLRNTVYNDSVYLPSHSLQNSHLFQQRQMLLQNGFSVNSVNNNGAISMPSPVLGGAFHNKTVPVMNMHNQSASALMMKHLPNIHSQQNGVTYSNFSHLREAGNRQQASYFKDCLPRSVYRNMDPNSIPMSHHSSIYRERNNLFQVWNEESQAEMYHGLKEKYLSQNSTELGAVGCSELEKMFQQLKFNDMATRSQNQMKYSMFPACQDGSL